MIDSNFPIMRMEEKSLFTVSLHAALQDAVKECEHTLHSTQGSVALDFVVSTLVLHQEFLFIVLCVMGLIVAILTRYILLQSIGREAS